MRNLQMPIGMVELPEGEFFRPASKFWELMQWFSKNQIRIKECGAGNGYTLVLAQAKGYNIRGYDICRRPDQDPSVILADVTKLHWESDESPLICRPDHGGWVSKVVNNARAAGRPSFYIGLSRNYVTDIGMFRTRTLARDVGQQGEHCWAILPLKSKSQPRRNYDGT